MEESKAKKAGGKSKGQKYKSLIVWNLLLKRTDENNALGISEIKDILEEYGISAERHSVSRDIKDLMTAIYTMPRLTRKSRGMFFANTYDSRLWLVGR